MRRARASISEKENLETERGQSAVPIAPKTAGAEKGKRTISLRWGGGRELALGEGRVAVFAGPCAVESRSQLLETAFAVKEAGAVGLRGGAFKPRTSPYSFQGLGEKGLELLAEAREATGLLVITEATSVEELPLVARYADVIQIGSRNMQNFPLLKAAGRFGRPVVLKRGLAATIEEWLLAAEYILASGHDRIILCERGIRTYEPMTRNTMDLGAVALLPQLASFPVMADPSHAAGRSDLVSALAKAAVAAGADSLLIEVHPRPQEALSDGAQSLNFKEFSLLMEDLRILAAAVGKQLVGLESCPKGVCRDAAG